MQYRYCFKALQCDKFISKFMRACDVGVVDVGVRVSISFISDKQLTNEEIEKVKEYLEKSKQSDELDKYLTGVELETVSLV